MEQSKKDEYWGMGILEMERMAPPELGSDDEDLDLIEVEDADTEEEFLKNAEKAWLAQHGEER